MIYAAGRSSGRIPRVAVAALELAARSARARVVAANPAVLVPAGRAPARLHVRPAVDRRRRVLQPLRAARSQPGRDRGPLTGRGLGVRATGPGPGGAVLGADLLRGTASLRGAALGPLAAGRRAAPGVRAGGAGTGDTRGRGGGGTRRF